MKGAIAMLYVTELIKQEIRFRKQFSDMTVIYKNNQGEFIWNRETKSLYYKGNNRKYSEFMGIVAI
jgi:hypothetical protein